MSTFMSTICVVMTAAWLPACLEQEEGDQLGEITDVVNEEDPEATEVEQAEAEITPRAGVFDVGVIPDSGVGCPSGSEEIVIRMDDEDDNSTSSRTGFVGKTNFQESNENTRFYFCKVNGSVFLPFSRESDAANLRDDYAVLKLGTTCPAGSQQFSRGYDNEDDDNANFFIGVIAPNISTSNTRLFFCLFRFAPPGVGIQSSFPNLGTGFRYGVFAPSDFNRGPLAFGNFRSDDEDDGNANSYDAPSDALLAAQRIIQPAPNASATIHRVVRAR